jgi:hypothetical protein
MKPLEKRCGNLKQKKINDMENQKIDPLALGAALYTAGVQIKVLDGRLVELAQKVIDENQRLTDRLYVLEAEIMALHGDAKRQGLN